MNYLGADPGRAALVRSTEPEGELGESRGVSPGRSLVEDTPVVASLKLADFSSTPCGRVEEPGER